MAGFNQDNPFFDMVDLRNRFQPHFPCQLLMGQGDLSSTIVLFQMSPDAKEASLSRVAIGEAGSILGILLESIGLARKGVYLTNVVKFFIPAPIPHDMMVFSVELLREEIKLLKPKVVVSLGEPAARQLLPKMILENGIGNFYLHPDGYKIFPVYHPSECIADRMKLITMKSVFKKIAEHM